MAVDLVVTRRASETPRPCGGAEVGLSVLGAGIAPQSRIRIRRPDDNCPSARLRHFRNKPEMEAR
jgi:hypothetical protein